VLALRVHQVCSVGVAALSLVHLGYTVRFHQWNAGAVWFSAAGLAWLLLAVVNWAARADANALRVRAVTRATNVVAALYVVAVVVAVPEPQAFLLAALVVGQALAGLKVLARPT
jgi:hypothetical protein